MLRLMQLYWMCASCYATRLSIIIKTGSDDNVSIHEDSTDNSCSMMWRYCESQLVLTGEADESSETCNVIDWFITFSPVVQCIHSRLMNLKIILNYDAPAARYSLSLSLSPLLVECAAICRRNVIYMYMSSIIMWRNITTHYTCTSQVN